LIGGGKKKKKKIYAGEKKEKERRTQKREMGGEGVVTRKSFSGSGKRGLQWEGKKLDTENKKLKG